MQILVEIGGLFSGLLLVRTPTCMPWLDACHLHYLFVGVTNLFCCKGHCVHESQSARSNLQKGSSFISRCPTYVGHECSAEGLADGCPSAVLFVSRNFYQAADLINKAKRPILYVGQGHHPSCPTAVADSPLKKVPSIGEAEVQAIVLRS